MLAEAKEKKTQQNTNYPGEAIPLSKMHFGNNFEQTAAAETRERERERGRERDKRDGERETRETERERRGDKRKRK